MICARVRDHLSVSGHRYRWGLFDGVPVAPVVQTILRAVPIVPAAWRVPPPTAAKIAAEAERQRVIAEGQAQLKAWRERGCRVPRP